MHFFFYLLTSFFFSLTSFFFSLTSFFFTITSFFYFSSLLSFLPSLLSFLSLFFLYLLHFCLLALAPTPSQCSTVMGPEICGVSNFSFTLNNNPLLFSPHFFLFFSFFFPSLLSFFRHQFS